LARSGGTATALHNNCSGKHAGFLCLACAIAADPARYVQPAHPVQRLVRDTLEVLSEAALPPEVCAVDGCSVPTWALPLVDLARAFACFGTGHRMESTRAAAAQRLRAACAAKPWFVAGTGRFCTDIMGHFGARVFVKTGAEGVFCGALPELGYGIAIKCDDGQGRAAEVATAAMIERFLRLDEGDRIFLERFVRPVLRNWKGTAVGGLRPADALVAPV
jgi:L-asparaginase II